MERNLLSRKKLSVRRCLFGRPTNTDEFVKNQRRLAEEEEKRFKRTWSLDGVENDIQWTKVDQDIEHIPDYFKRGYSVKCRRRAVRPCIGRKLSFADADEDMKQPPSPQVVEYCAASTVEVFIGLLSPHQSPEIQPPVTPKKDFDGSHNTAKSESRKSDSSHCLKRLKQKRLTDIWRVLKKRQRRSLSSSKQLHKTARIDRHHPDFLYIGSSVNLRHRWSNHKSDCKLRKGHKCHVAQHFLDKQHPVDPQFTCLRIFAIEAVHKKENLVSRDTVTVPYNT
ncbi:hypothetical protein ACOMHN_062394 [Nucella lapillus]